MPKLWLLVSAGAYVVVLDLCHISMLLYGKPVIENLRAETKTRLEANDKLDGYVAIFLLSDDVASETYVRMKSQYAQKLGIYVDVLFGEDREMQEIREEMNRCNTDDQCLGILVQMPVCPRLRPYVREIVNMIVPHKDVDGLGCAAFGELGFGRGVLGATPQAALHILDHYGLGNVQGKVCLVVSQSNLIGKPLAIQLMKRGATVISANSHTGTKVLQESFGLAEYVFCATGVKHLIGETLQGENLRLEEKVMVDIGRGSDEDGAYGDVDWKYFQDKVRGVTPVPGGVGPVTVATLFHNIVRLGECGDVCET